MGVAGSVGLLSLANDALPVVQLRVNDVKRRVMVDSGCSRCLVHISCCGSWTPCNSAIMTMDGARHQCMGVSNVCLQEGSAPPKFVQALVVNFRPLNFDFVLGMNGVRALGGMRIESSGKVTLGRENPAHEWGQADLRGVPAGGVAGKSEVKQMRQTSDEGSCTDLVIEENDFVVRFDANKKQWTAAWKWTEDRQPKALKNCIAEYSIKPEAKEEYEREIAVWMERGWLRRYDEDELGPPRGLIPLMAVVQRNKAKVRPVLDFRELNEHIQSYTANADVCAERMRQWRKQGCNVALIDLTKAYLQIAMDKELWSYQTVMYEGQRLCLTRLGFGLNVAPVIMRAVLDAVLKQEPAVYAGTSAYIDDVFVNEDIVSAEVVVSHLRRFGLSCKPPERLRDGARVLGVRVDQDGCVLAWKRENDFGEIPSKLTRRSVFSLCGKLIGHLPVCGWLRVASAYVKRRANAVTDGWDDPVKDDGSVRRMLAEMVCRVKSSDPAKGRWDVPSCEMTVWTDASSLALGVVLEVEGSVIEDACWLRAEDATHINLAELDAAVKGVNMALAWGATKVRLFTDSKTVFHWISDALSGRARLKTKASSEMLIRRRIALLTSLVTEYELSMSVDYVTSSCNLADSLTRVPHEWLRPEARQRNIACGAQADADTADVRLVHETCGHPGIRRTLYFARRQDQTVTRQQAREAVRSCQACQAIDPAPVRWTRGSLGVDRVWQRLAVDVTHVGRTPYLTMVDCGPSRFAIWRQLRNEDGTSICRQLETVFCERGAPEEVLLDNAAVFHSRLFRNLLEVWNVAVRYRCANEASGNGVVERNHRSIKTMVERSQSTVEDAVYWYNVTPKDDCSESTAPGTRVYRYQMRVRPALPAGQPLSPDVNGSGLRVQARASGGSYRVGDTVWVRRRGSRCFTRSETGTVTAVVSDLCVEVDGIPRHIRNLRPRQRSRVTLHEERRGASAIDDPPLLITLPQMLQPAETRPSLRQVEPAPAGSQERAVFTLPSRSAARCLRLAPPRRQL